MSKKQFKSQASSSRVGPGSQAFGASSTGLSSTFGSGGSPLSYLAEQPDLTSLSDPNVIVSFKNLSKKDSTTKAKALDDLQAWIGSQDAVEDAFLDAWVKVYPRTSIDVSRRVRQLAHNVHGHICKSSGKRIAKHMPAVVGAWLSGLHDGDKVVSRAAQEALEHVFPSAEKQDNLWKVYQSSLVSFARDAVLTENAQTLSDERTTTKEDSETKYFRVVSCSIALVTDLLTKLDRAEIDKCGDTYTEVLAEKTLWDHISTKDTQLRRVVMRLLRVCISKHPDLISGNMHTIKKAVLSKASLKHQTGSSTEFTELLVVLARFMPSFWDSIGKASVLDLLQVSFKQGSQSGPVQYWDRVALLFTTLPPHNQDMDPKQALQTLEALHTGIARKDEPRASQDGAWSCYFKVADILVQRVIPDARLVVLQDMVLPVIRQAVSPNQEDAAWTIPGSRAVAIASKGLYITDFEQVASESWVSMAVDFVSRLQTSLPEQARDFSTSQDAIKSEGERWFTMQKYALNEPFFEPLVDSTTNLILTQAFDQLNARKGKPYGAAATIDAALSNIGEFIASRERLRDNTASFIIKHMHELVFSPSGSYLMKSFYQYSGHPEFQDGWKSTLEEILSTPDGPSKFSALHTLLDSTKLPPNFNLAAEHSNLQNFVVHQVQKSLKGGLEWPSILTNDSSSVFLASSTRDQILADLTSNLSINGNTYSALNGLQAILKGNKQLLRPYLASSSGSELMRIVLHTTEASDEREATLAKAINSSLQAMLAVDSGDSESSESILAVIDQGLYEANPNSLSIKAVADLASKMVSMRQDKEVETRLLPHVDKWLEAVMTFVSGRISKSLAITNPLGGAVYLVRDYSQLSGNEASQISRDARGYPAALRIAMYTLKVFGQANIEKTVTETTFAQIYAIFRLVVQLVSDELGLAGANTLWRVGDIEVEEEMMEFVADGQRLLNQWLQDDGASPAGKVGAISSTMKLSCVGANPMSFHMSRAFSDTLSSLLEHSQASQRLSAADLDSELRQLRKDGDFIMLTAFINAYSSVLGSSTYLSRLCNENVADLTGTDIETKADGALSQLVILNVILQDQDHLVDNIAKQRLIFYAKHVIPWLSSADADASLKAETCRSLVFLLPAMADIYGEHWQGILGSLLQIWSEPRSSRYDETRIPLYHASLKLFNTLVSLSRDEDANEDLKDALSDTGESLGLALLALLTQLGAYSDMNNQPLRIVNELLARLISAQPPSKIDNPEDLYSLMAVESSAVQHTAFELLHKQIPRAQEQISLDAALDNKTARLPEELLSLVLEAPPASYDSATFERAMPPVVRTYLSSWLLIFDHFRNASDKVKSDYASQLKDGGYLDSLLTFIFSFLGHAHGRPIDASKFDVSAYGFDIQDSPIKDVQWLLSHLYFLCLQRMPSLAKSWWLDSKSRQIRVNVESWTEKYISPLIISTALDAVTAWAASQDDSSDEALVVKANYRTKEVTAAKEIDEQMMTMAIRLPPNFPLGQADVIGHNRVAVDEKKWRSWLQNCKGVILFSDNSLIDGIIAFRRNVAGALKGQTECAICYSLVSADKQLPTKKCGTCKNLFHGSCLYRWFKSSNSSSCPLCRTSFNYS